MYNIKGKSCAQHLSLFSVNCRWLNQFGELKADITEGISKFGTKVHYETLICTGNRWNEGNEASHGACR